jgi:hypothetical protein
MDMTCHDCESHIGGDMKNLKKPLNRQRLGIAGLIALAVIAIGVLMLRKQDREDSVQDAKTSRTIHMMKMQQEIMARNRQGFQTCLARGEARETCEKAFGKPIE